jgi:hypothetical protein
MGCDSLDDGRGCVVADLNNDGRLDLIISNNNSRPTIYLNNQPQVGNWLRVDMHGAVRGSSRDPLGTRVDVLVKYNGELWPRLVFVVNRPDRILNFPLDPVGWSFRLADLISLGFTSRILQPIRMFFEGLPLGS